MSEPDGDGPREPREWFAEAARAEKPDLALLCLLLGAVIGACPDPADPARAERTVDEGQMELDRLSGLLPYSRGRAPEQWARTLAEVLGEGCGFGGAAGDYQRLESSLLGAVLRRGRGLPILLSVVWLEVARRAGAPVRGVALPGHYVVGFGGRPGELVLADPFAGGRLLPEAEARLLVSGTTGRPLSRAMLEAAGPLETVLRVLSNIREWAVRRPERTDVRLAALDLSLLLPHHPLQLRHERAKVLVDRGEFAAAAKELEEYAELISAAEPQAADAVHREARIARARLN
ncbi:transglutaminase-like domain-containing protein [Streptomyces sp. XM4193]|uniref:transglutaminase-like domain-containing protein n=1 Tax=Streptomyces sp. XM4193 TaxID=2929782 RepID=UPI001FFAD044|nr:transglutaminase-like domain-containing protein [Streptomyces sp. XM4193]MCK1796032.1 transglutaminase-like domain-containing protein [Streptomyces sp. XM4193]